MRSFYRAWTEDLPVLSQPAREFDGVNLPSSLAGIPWFHNVILIMMLKDPGTRLWYAEQTLQHGWSRPVIVRQIKSGLHERQGKAATNFSRTLPSAQADLARQILVLKLLIAGPMGRSAIAKALGHERISGAVNRSLRELLEKELIQRTLPEKRNSRLQKYRLTVKSRA